MTTPDQKRLLKAVDDLVHPLLNLLYSYERLDFYSNVQTSENYPFGLSYDGWIAEFFLWKETLYKRWVDGITEYSPTITIGELKNVIADLPDSTQITVKNKDWYLNITECHIPDNYGLFTLNLGTSDTFDTTQL